MTKLDILQKAILDLSEVGHQVDLLLIQSKDLAEINQLKTQQTLLSARMFGIARMITLAANELYTISMKQCRAIGKDLATTMQSIQNAITTAVAVTTVIGYVDQVIQLAAAFVV